MLLLYIKQWTYSLRFTGYDGTAIFQRTLARGRQVLEWIFSIARYCQSIRLNAFHERLAEGEQFIFTDESTIQLDIHRRKSYRLQES